MSNPNPKYFKILELLNNGKHKNLTEIQKETNITYSHVHDTVVKLEKLQIVKSEKTGRIHLVWKNAIKQYIYDAVHNLKAMDDIK